MTDCLQMFSLFFTGVISILVGRSYRKSGIAKAWVIGAGFFVLGFYLDALFQLIMQAFIDVKDQMQMMQLLGVAVSKSIQIAVLLGMKVFAGENEERAARGSTVVLKTVGVGSGTPDSGNVGWQYYEGLSLGISVFFLVLGMTVWRQNSVETIKIGWMLGLLLVLAVYYMSVYIHQRRQKAKATQTEAESKKHEAEMYLESVENNYQRTRELWHDLKNHINLMNLLLQEEKYGELKDYLRIFGEDVDSLTLPVKSGNVIVDALLADKLNKAKREKIEVSLSLCNLTELKLRSDEICGLFGNLLDNALEANLHLREGRSLEVTCKELEECFYIRVRNPVRGSCLLKTEKSDRRNQVGHGLGLRSVERIVHGCGGDLAVENGEKYFTVVVRLPR